MNTIDLCARIKEATHLVLDSAGEVGGIEVDRRQVGHEFGKRRGEGKEDRPHPQPSDPRRLGEAVACVRQA